MRNTNKRIFTFLCMVMLTVILASSALGATYINPSSSYNGLQPGENGGLQAVYDPVFPPTNTSNVTYEWYKLVSGLSTPWDYNRDTNFSASNVQTSATNTSIYPQRNYTSTATTRSIEDGGRGRTYSTGWYLARTVIPGEIDKIKSTYFYQYAYSSKYTNTVYSYVRFWFEDGTYYQTPQQSNTYGGWKRHTNIYPNRTVTKVDYYLHDHYNYGWYINQIDLESPVGNAGPHIWETNNVAEGYQVDGFNLTFKVTNNLVVKNPNETIVQYHTGDNNWLNYTYGDAVNLTRTEELYFRFNITGNDDVITDIDYGLTALVHQKEYDYVIPEVTTNDRIFSDSGKGSVTERLIPGDVWNLKVTESYNPTVVSYSDDVTISTSPSAKFLSFNVSRFTQTADYCFNVTDLNNETSVNAAVQYSVDGGAPQQTTPTSVSVVGTKVCKTIPLQFGSSYIIKGVAYTTAGGFTLPTYYTFPELQSLYVGTPDIVDYDGRDRLYDSGTGFTDINGLREGALYNLTEVYIETNISNSGLTLHWYNGVSWNTYPMLSSGNFSYYILSGLTEGAQTMYITQNGTTVADWVKPGLVHPLGGDRVDETRYTEFAGVPENIDYRLMYMNTVDYNSTAYEWCLDNTGGDIYQCYNVGWWPNSYDVGRLDRGGIIGPGLYDTGLLSSSLDSNRPYSVNNQRYEFGGQNTETVKQEDADSYSIVPYYLYVNYTKIPGVERENTRWYVKHSFDGTNPIEDWIEIPQNCWDYAGTYGDIVLRIKSEGHDVNLNLSTEPACYDGVSWTPLGNPQRGQGNFEAEYSANASARLIDGADRWGATWKTDTNEWYWAGNSYARIYEERMYWDAVGLAPTTQYWWDDSIVPNGTINNYYTHFWMDDELNRTGTPEDINFEYTDLFKWGHDESNTYDYWRENNDTVWVKTNLTAGETYTFVIGDDENVAYSPKPDNVFLFLQDFRDINANTELGTLPYWEEVSNEDQGASYIVGSEGAFYYYDEDAADVDYYKTNFTFNPGVVLEIYTKDDPAGQEWPLEFGFYDGTSNRVAKVKNTAFQDNYYLASTVDGITYLNTGNTSKYDVGVPTYKKFKVVWDSGLAQLVVNDTLEYQVDYNVPTTPMNLVIGNVYPGGTAGWDTSGRTQYLFARKHVATEPEVNCNDNVCTVYAPESVSNYQLKLNVAPSLDGDLFVYREADTPGFNEISRTRLTKDDVFSGYGMPYWRETNDASNSSVWTKVTMNAGDSYTVRISDKFAYPEDPENVFEFFDGYDDTEDGTLNPARWANYNANDYHVNTPSYPNELYYNWTGGGWDTRGPWTVNNFVRDAKTGYVLEFDYKPLEGTGANRMFGWHDTTASDHYQYLIYGIYDNNGADTRVYEDNAARYTDAHKFNRNGTNYKIRITARDTTQGGAYYEISDDNGLTWYELYNSTYSTETNLKIGSDDYGVDYVQDSTRVRKYYDTNPVSVECSNNLCEITANEDVVDYQVKLETNLSGELNIVKKDLTIQEPNFFSSTQTQTLIAGYKEFTPVHLDGNLNGDIYDFGLQVYGKNTNQQIGKYQPGFVIFNLPDVATLKISDSDGDGLNDYEELFVYYTNPLSSDTDEGGETDREEVLAGRNPLEYFDDVVKVNDVNINQPYPKVGDVLSCSFNVTNDDTYNNIDVGVSWRKAVDNNEWFTKYIDDPLNSNYVDDSKSNALFTNESNGTVSYTQVVAPYTNMFTNGGVGRTYSTGWRLVATINSPPIPAPYDVEKLYMYMYRYGGKYTNYVYSYTRWYYKDGTPTTNTATISINGAGWRTHYNPHPGAEVDKIEVYGHDYRNYGWYINQIQVWGKNGFDGFDSTDDNFITGNVIWPETVDRFRLSYDLEGGVVDNYYDDDNDYENHQLAYYRFTDKSFLDEYLNQLDGTQENTSFRADRFGTVNSSLDSINSSTVFVVPDNSKLNDFSTLSLIGEINLDSLPITEGTIIDKDGIFRLAVNNLGQIVFYTGDDWNGTKLTSSQTLSTGVDYEIIGVFDGRSKNIYINGEVDPNLRTVDNVPLGTNINDMSVGGHWNGTGYDEILDGAIDDVHIYDVGMTAEDVSNYYAITSVAPYDVWNDWTKFPSNMEITIGDTNYLRLMLELDETEPRARQIKFEYHPTQTFIDDNNYDYTFYNINRGELYTTTNGTGSYTGPLENYGQYKCVIDVFNQNVNKIQSSDKVSVYPLENLNVTYPDSLSIDNEPFFTTFSATDYDGGLYCSLIANGDTVGSYGHVDTDVVYDNLGLTVKFNYLITEMKMSEGCLGDITLSPVPEYPLKVCLEDENGAEVPGSCNTYTSGEYGPGDILTTGEVNRSFLEQSDKFRFKFHWNRIGYVAMDNPELDGNFDHGQSEFGDHNHVCQRLDNEADLVCGGSVYQYYWADTQAQCSHGGGDTFGDMHLDTGASFDNSYQLFSSSTCGPGTEITNNYTDDNLGYYSITTDRRVYEGYWRTGGTDATLGCVQAAGQKRNYDCGQCDTFNLRWIPTTCSEGIEDSYPDGLCTYSGNTTAVSDYFTYQEDFDNPNIVFTDKVQAKGNVSWNTASNWPVIDDDYNWNVSCSAIGQNYSISSDTRLYKYDLAAPTINSYSSNENLFFPEIGDSITLSANVQDDDTVNHCTLYVDDNGEGMVPQSNYTVNANIADVDMSFQVSPNSIKDAIVHPPYFRTGNVVWTKLSMNAGETITLVMDNTNNVYDTYSSDGDSVFEFFEPFDDNPIDSSVWDAISTESTTLTYNTGSLTFYDDDSSNKDYYITKKLFSEPSILEWSQRDYTTEEWPLEVGFGRGTSNTIGKLKNPLIQDDFLFKSYLYGVISESPTYDESDVYQKFKVVWKDGESKLYRDDALLDTLTSNIPTVDVPLVFGDTTSGGAAGTDTKGALDWMFVRKYSDNMPSISCDGNICVITADNGAFENLQIPLETSYTTGDISLSYAKDNSQVAWTTECFDDAGNGVMGTPQTFNVKDNTAPLITLSDKNGFDDSNKSTHSNAVRDLGVAIDYFDYNLFQASEDITCEDDGSIYQWEDIDVEVFNFDPTYQHTTNYTLAYDVYDDTHSDTTIDNTVNQQGWVGQIFDSFYYVSSLDYKVETQDASVQVQTYDGVGWSTVKTTARSTGVKTDSVDINDSIKGIRFFFEDTTLATSTNKVFYMKYSYVNGLSQNGAFFQHTETVDTTGLPMQKCVFNASASDDHTDALIPDYVVDNTSDGLEYQTDTDALITVTHPNVGENFTSSTTKHPDRYTFSFDFSNKSLSKDFKLKSLNGNKIYYRPHSKYDAHFVVWNADKKDGNWVDFVEVGNPGVDFKYTVTKVNDFEYDINVAVDTPLNNLTPEQEIDTYGVQNFEFFSIGGTNVAHKSWEFYIGGALNVTGVNVFDQSTFTNYTASVKTISGYPGAEFNETYNVSDTNFVEHLPEGVYNVTFSHPHFFDQTYIVNITTQYDDCYQESADINVTCQGTVENEINTGNDGSYVDDPGWNDLGNAIDANWSNYASVTNTVGYKYYYFTYDMVSDAVPVWEIGLGVNNTRINFTPQIGCLDDADGKLKLRVGFENSIAQNDWVFQCSDDGAWSDINDYEGELGNFSNYLWEEGVHWKTLGANLQKQNYESYQAKITFQLRDVKTQELLDDLNMSITIGNFTTNQYFPPGTNDLTVLVDAAEANILASKQKYIDLNKTYTFDYKQEETFVLDMNFYSLINLYDEKTLEPFDMTKPDKVEFLVICEDSTRVQELTSNVQTVEITCPYKKFKFLLTYGTSGYYRTFLTPPEDAFNQSIYLIEISSTSYIYSSFTIDDLLGQYDNPRIYINKLIENDRVQITADYTDVEGKIGAFLIENQEYIIEIQSDNQPTREMGSYAADVGGDKTLRLYDIDLSTDSVGFYNNVGYSATTEERGNETYAVLVYTDAENKTDDVTVTIHDGNTEGPVLYTLSGTPTYSEQYGAYTLQVEQLLTAEDLNKTLSVKLGIDHEDGYRETGKYLHRDYALPLPNDLDRGFLDWVILLFLSVVAIVATIRTASVMSMVLIGFAALFVIFGWFGLSSGVLLLSALVSLLTILKDGEKKTK